MFTILRMTFPPLRCRNCDIKLLSPLFERNASKYTKSESESEFYGEQLGGYEHKEEIEPFKSRWRAPFNERSIWKTKFFLFGKRKFAADVTRYNPDNFKYFNFGSWLDSKKKKGLRDDQIFIEERLDVLGCDLAAAHFVVFRGGAVKFHNRSDWIFDDADKNKEYDDELPNVFHPDYMVEAINLAGTQIVYEGLVNIMNLHELKWLSFSQCENFDNWCLDMISGEYGETLEYLDLSYTKVSHHGLNAIYRFRKLKCLKLDDSSDDPEFYRTCMEIRKSMPELEILGLSAELIGNIDEGNVLDSKTIENSDKAEAKLN